MVIVHGSGGVSDRREGEWARRFNEIGVAALVIDSFGLRGISETATDQSKLSVWATVADALNALKALSGDPRIDPNRIGIIGFSRGGRVALYTALEPVLRSIIDAPRMFAIHIPVYPPCHARYVTQRVTGSPVSMHLGEKDDYTPIGPCQDYARWFESKGALSTTTVYSGAYHGFDLPTGVKWSRNVQTGRNCSVEADLESGKWRRLDTNKTFRDETAVSAYYKRCGQRGAHFGGHTEARQQVFENVLGVLKNTFKL